MNTTIETLLTRKSVRKFTPEPVTKEMIDLLLAAAMQAPSACNQQARHYIVITDRETLDRLSTRHGGVNFVRDASVAILISGQPNATILDYYWEDDCAASTQNLLLAAHSLGLGATWTGVDRKDAESIAFFRQHIDLPEEYIPFSLIPIGYPREQSVVKSYYDEKKVQWVGAIPK